jgi:hypothetical protein
MTPKHNGLNFKKSKKVYGLNYFFCKIGRHFFCSKVKIKKCRGLKNILYLKYFCDECRRNKNYKLFSKYFFEQSHIFEQKKMPWSQKYFTIGIFL